MPDLQTSLSNLHRAVDAFLAAARDVPAQRWSQPPAPGKWSPGQVVEHVALAFEANRGVLHAQPPGSAAPRLLRPLLRRFLLVPVLRRGGFYPGSRSPKIFRPSVSPAPQASLVARLRAAAESFEREAGASRIVAVDHPFFGRLPLVDFVRLQEIHSDHHRAQLAPDRPDPVQ